LPPKESSANTGMLMIGKSTFSIRSDRLVISAGLLFLAATIGCGKEPQVSTTPNIRSNLEECSPMQPDVPISFGYKLLWLAVQTDDPKDVVIALHLTHVRESNWKAGVDAAYDRQVFVTPSIYGWVLAASFALPEIAEDRNDVPALLTELGKTFADVQFFGTHRIVEYHAWARAIDGKVIRQYAYLGESGKTLRDEGDPTSEEKSLGLVYDESAQAFDVRNWPDEEDVMKLAGAWSVNPDTLDTISLPKSLGFVGNLPKHLRRR
jgi:hypothetical protein